MSARHNDPNHNAGWAFHDLPQHNAETHNGVAFRGAAVDASDPSVTVEDEISWDDDDYMAWDEGDYVAWD